MHILVFGAHPDDIEFGVGGLIIKEIQKGNRVRSVVCSLGEAGSNGTPRGRKKEAQNAAALIGAEIEFLDLGGDCHIEYKPKNSIRLAEIIRRFKPDIVLAQSLIENQHPDHRALAAMVRDACRLARFGGLTELKKLPTHRVSALYYYPSTADRGRAPDIIVDVSGVQEKWLAAMACHKSQMKTKAYANLVSLRAAALGAGAGVECAVGLWTNDPVMVDAISDLSLSSRNY